MISKNIFYYKTKFEFLGNLILSEEPGYVCAKII